MRTWLLEKPWLWLHTLYFVGKVMSLLFNMLSKLVIAFLPRKNRLVISWLQSPSLVILEPKKIKLLTISIVSPSICHEMMGLDTIILVFWMLNFKPTFNNRVFSSSLLSAIRVVSSVYLRLLTFLPTILIPPVLHPARISPDILCIKVTYTQYTALTYSFPNLELVVVPCLVLTVGFLTCI